MKHIQKLRKLILTLGILAGMSMTVNAEEQVITCTGTKGEANLLNMFEGSRITYTVGNGMNEAQFYKNGIFTAPEGKCFTKIRVAYGDTNWGGFVGRARTVKHGNAIVIGDDGNTLKIEFTVDDLAIYNVTLNTNGGTVNYGNITTYTEFYGATLPTNVTRNGYTFEGWYDNAELTGEPVTSIASDATGDKEYWAKWPEIPRITVTAKADPYNTGAYYATFYDSTTSYTADCEVYYATANAGGRFTLEKAEGNVIKAGEGVILKATGENVTLTKTTASYDSLLTGSNTETTVENALVLSLGKNGVWFYKYSGTLGANKAYLAQ